jgi:hypothetical protein
MTRTTRPHDLGNATLELVVLTPALLLVIGLLIAWARVVMADGSVQAAARDGARQASIARDPATARRWARDSVLGALDREQLKCRPVVEVGGFANPVGSPGSIMVSVECTVRLADLLAPGLPGAVTRRATFTSPLDPHRGRSSIGVAKSPPPGGDSA